MTLHRIQAKLFVENPDALDLQDLIPIFHGWIQKKATEELLIDVANYEHVPEGPGIMLIGHEADYSLDLARGRPGILYTRKRDWPDGLEAAIRLALRQVISAADRLEEDSNLVFRRDEIELIFPDRLNVPNDSRSLGAVRGPLESALGELFPGAEPSLEWTADDERMPFGVRAVLQPTPA